MLDLSLFKPNTTVAVAISGGKDSVCLLHLLSALSRSFPITVKAINIDHGIRGENSENDSLFVKSLCNSLSIPLYFEKVDSPLYSKNNGVSLEEAARILRYKCFYKAIGSGFCDHIATAHHSSDNAETILFNLFRGCSVKGATGIKKISPDGKIIRPMLQTSKKQIDDYIKANSLNYVTDETNFDDSFSRNFIRLDVSPLIKSRFPEFESSISRFSEILTAEDNFLDSLASKYLTKKSDDEYSVSKKIDDVLFSRACVMALKALGIKKDYEKQHIDRLIALKAERNGAKIDLPLSVKAACDYEEITLYKKKEKVIFPATKFNLGEFYIEKNKITFAKVPTASFGDGDLYFDIDKIPSSAVIRTRKEGDSFIKFGGKRKKLKDYLIDKKIPSRKRDELLVVADGNEILLICGIEISDLIKVDKTTLNVVKCITE